MDYMSPKLSQLTATSTLGAVETNDIYAVFTSQTGVTDEAHAEYNPATTYNDGDYAKIGNLKKFYRCAADGTLNKHPLDYPDLWVDYGYLNSYRMLSNDEFIDGKTTGVDVVIEVDFSRCDTFAFVSADFIEVTIELVNNTTMTTSDPITYKGRDIGCLSYSEYYYTDLKVLSRLTVDGLEWLPDSTLRLTFTGASSIGGFVYGLREKMGLTLTGTSLKFEDTSKIITSPITGNRSVTRYGSVRVVDVNVVMNTEDFNIIANKIERIIGRNILWLPNDGMDNFLELITIGYIEDMSLPLEGSTALKTNATIIGVL